MEPRVAALVLAAGSASRFVGAKLLAVVDGRPLLQHVLDRVADSGLDGVVVVLGRDADALEAAMVWRNETRVRNPEPERGLASSLAVGMATIDPVADSVVILLGDQPLVATSTIRALIDAPANGDRPIVAPVYRDDRGRNPVLLRRAAFRLMEAAEGDRGLGPLLAAHPELVQEIPIDGENPDVDTREDLVRVLEATWARRVRMNREQVDRFREVPDGTDFYAPVQGLFRADPTRTDDPTLDHLLELLRPGETWLDVGAGAGRYALPIARALDDSGGSVVALDPSSSMLESLREIAEDYDIENVRTVHARWPPANASDFEADVSLIAHVGYDIEAIGPFLDALEMATRRLCVAVLMERQPSSIADALWPPVHGEERVPLPALPEFLALLEARGRQPSVTMLEREARRFASREELAGFLRRQLWTQPGTAKDKRFEDALNDLLDETPEGFGLVGQRPLPVGIVTWAPSLAS
jgi:CTP:molybdopterin cytidylyltransferase MocA/SAM-dependent methyltransferase